jgi:hypothetical protein
VPENDDQIELSQCRSKDPSDCGVVFFAGNTQSPNDRSWATGSCEAAKVRRSANRHVLHRSLSSALTIPVIHFLLTRSAGLPLDRFLSTQYLCSILRHFAGQRNTNKGNTKEVVEVSWNTQEERNIAESIQLRPRLNLREEPRLVHGWEANRPAEHWTNISRAQRFRLSNSSFTLICMLTSIPAI